MELQVGEYYWIRIRRRSFEIAVYDGRFYALDMSQYIDTDEVEVIQHIERPRNENQGG